MRQCILFWALGWSLIAFLTMGADKRRARLHRWRVPEAALFMLALVGGSWGAVLGMYLFRHKTKHWKFRLGLPILMLLQTGAILYFLYKGVI